MYANSKLVLTRYEDRLLHKLKDPAQSAILHHTERLLQLGRSGCDHRRMSAPSALAHAAACVANEQSTIHGRFLEAGDRIGLSRPMVQEAIRNHFSRMTQQQLSRNTAASGYGLIFHILAGNLFLSGIDSITSAVLSGACSLVRCSSQDQYFPRLWAEAISAADPQLGESIHVDYWSANDIELTAAVADVADCVVAYGSDDSIEAVQKLLPSGKPFMPHGTRLSFALLSSEALTSRPEELANSLAYDFSVYDQQGCMSPRAAFLEAVEPGAMDVFSNSFIEAMRRLTVELPSHVLDLAERAALARARDEALIDAATGGETRILSRAEDGFVATVRQALPYSPGSMNRFADLRIFQSPEEVEAALLPWTGRIISLGMPEVDNARFASIARKLQCERICAIGDMQSPEFSSGF